MHCGILVNKALHEIVAKDFCYFAKSLAKKTIEGDVGAFLHAAVDDHIAHLLLMPKSCFHLYNFVKALLIVHGTLNGKVDDSFQVE